MPPVALSDVFTRDRLMLALVVFVIAKAPIGEPIAVVLKKTTGIDVTAATKAKEASKSGLDAIVDNQNRDYTIRQKISDRRLLGLSDDLFGPTLLEEIQRLCPPSAQSIPGPESPEPLPPPEEILVGSIW